MTMCIRCCTFVLLFFLGKACILKNCVGTVVVNVVVCFLFVYFLQACVLSKSVQNLQ